jgi:hypothetical protein
MGPRADSARRAAMALVCLLALAFPQLAAGSGNGLYEPFPEAAVKKRAERYVEQLRGRIPAAQPRFTDAQLTRGAFVAGAAPLPRPTPAADSATGRAGDSAADGVPFVVQLFVLLGLLAVPMLALRARARVA